LVLTDAPDHRGDAGNARVQERAVHGIDRPKFRRLFKLWGRVV
jgi:hypothetical protein